MSKLNKDERTSLGGHYSPPLVWCLSLSLSSELKGITLLLSKHHGEKSSLFRRIGDKMEFDVCFEVGLVCYTKLLA